MGTPSVSEGRVNAKATVTILNTLDASSSAVPEATHTLDLSLSITNGVTTGKADRAWGDIGRTIASSGTEDLDIYDLASFNIGSGAGLDALGQAVTFAEIICIQIRSQSGSDEDLIVGNKNTAAAWNSMFNASDTAALTLQPGDWFQFCSPIADPALAVADSANHILKMTAGGGGSAGVIYDIVIIGRDT